MANGTDKPGGVLAWIRLAKLECPPGTDGSELLSAAEAAKRKAILVSYSPLLALSLITVGTVCVTGLTSGKWLIPFITNGPVLLGCILLSHFLQAQAKQRVIDEAYVRHDQLKVEAGASIRYLKYHRDFLKFLGLTELDLTRDPSTSDPLALPNPKPKGLPRRKGQADLPDINEPDIKDLG